MKKDIQNYFDTYRSNLQNKSLISTEEVRSLVNSSEDGSEFINNKFRNIRRYVIMSTVASIIVTAISIFLFSFSNNTENKKADSNVQTRPIDKVETRLSKEFGKEGLSKKAGNILISKEKKTIAKDKDYVQPMLRIMTFSSYDKSKKQKNSPAPDNSSKNTDTARVIIKHGDDIYDQVFPVPSSDMARDSAYLLNKPIEANIKGINTLDLTAEELKALNITYKDSTVEVIFEAIDHKGFFSAEPKELDSLGYNLTLDSFLVRKLFIAGAKASGVGDIKVLPNDHRSISEYSKIAPITVSQNSMLLVNSAPLLKYLNDSLAQAFYTHTENNRRMYEKSAREMHYLIGFIDSLFSKLIPVRFPAVIILRGKPRPCTVDVWFYPNDEFLSALPKRYSEPLRKELAALADIEENNTPVEIACKGLENQETFFDICRMKSGAIERLSLFPNPATAQATTARYILTEPRKLRVTLHDINGKFLRTIKEEFPEIPGTHDLKIDLGGLQSGFYLVAIQSDKEEQVVQRLIVN